MSRKADGNKRKAVSEGLRVLRPDVAGIDIGSKEHWVCGPSLADGSPNVRTFGSTTEQLEALADWLVQQRVASVAMESTSVYWIPLHEVLESRGIEVLLVNARQLHNVPGRKTDFHDCQWIQLLHSCGLLRGSFHPAEAITRLRALQRQMGNLVSERSRFIQWMQKALDQMNVQVHRAVADITGETGLAIVRAIVAGERDPDKLAAHRDRRCRKSQKEIAQHLRGTWREEHLFNLAGALRLYDMVERELSAYEGRLMAELRALQPPERQDEAVPPHPSPKKEKAIQNRGEQEMRTTLYRFAGVDLTRIDGISATSAQVVLSEVGLDWTAFPTEDDWVSWLRLCPRTPISGGKPLKKRRNGLGANRVAAVLRMAASAVQRSKSALGAYYRRLSHRKGADVAVFATARKIATLVYRMLRYGQDYVDIGQQAYEQKFADQRIASIKQAAASLGYSLVATTELAAQAPT